MNRWTRVHPVALERLRARTRRPATMVIHDAGLSASEFQARLRDQSFTSDQVRHLAAALRTTPRELLTASTACFAAERIRCGRAARPDEGEALLAADDVKWFSVTH